MGIGLKLKDISHVRIGKHSLKPGLRPILCILATAVYWAFILASESSAAGRLENLTRMIGGRDAIMVVSPDGRVLLSKNEDHPLIPASTLKILTSLVALHYLGPDYQFVTEFYLDDHLNLTIKGYGDPLLVSEVVADIARSLGSRLDRINDLVLDDGFFAQPLVIPGVSSSAEPYDAPNGALCVNFNTVTFKKVNGRFVSAEPQTPLLPMVVRRVKSSGMTEGRIVLSHNENEITLYSGHLFAYFLEQNGVPMDGSIKIAGVRPEKDRLIFRHISPFTLNDIIERLLEYSNNYITNQILIASGAEAFGAPGTLDNGVRAAGTYAGEILKLSDVHLTEGSGISRDNRITARDMCRVLDAFAPHRALMRHSGRQYFKSGTLHGISTRAGYIESSDGGLNRFVVLLNSKGKSAEKIAHRLLRSLE